MDGNGKMGVSSMKRADFMSQLFSPSRTIELRWDDIDRILDVLVIYTKSGQRYIMNTAYFSMKLIPNDWEI